MIPCFSILASKIAWMVEPGGLQSMGVTKSQTQCDYTEENISEIEGPEIDIQNEAQRENTLKGMNRIGCETIPNIKNTYQKEMRERKRKHTCKNNDHSPNMLKTKKAQTQETQ